jgi:3-methyladenine DNA glycosylase AlkD
MSVLQALRERLAAAGDPSRAAGQQRYMKSALPYHGVTNPEVRAICKAVFATYPFDDPDRWRDDVARIWHSATHREERYTALDLAGQRAARPLQGLPRTARGAVGSPVLARAALTLYEELVVTGAWWDLVDDIATHRIGALLEYHPFVADEMRAWSRSDDVWKRRSAILCQIGRRAETDTTLLLELIEPALNDPSFWLRKAIGWALRQAARLDPDWVRETVERLGPRLSPLSRREAMKHLG